MRIEDINPNWDVKELWQRIIKEADEHDLILYLSGLDDDAMGRIESRKEMMKYMEECEKLMESVK